MPAPTGDLNHGYNHEDGTFKKLPGPSASDTAWDAVKAGLSKLLPGGAVKQAGIDLKDSTTTTGPTNPMNVADNAG